MTNLTEYEREINLAVNKLAKGAAWQDKEDLRQEGRLAVLSANLSGQTDKALVYKLVKNWILNVLMRGTPPKTLDIDNPSVRREADKVRVHFPNLDDKIDADTAVSLLSRFPPSDQFLIVSLFGLDNNTYTAKQVGQVLGKSEDWVDKRKKLILKKLKAIMEGKR